MAKFQASFLSTSYLCISFAILHLQTCFPLFQFSSPPSILPLNSSLPFAYIHVKLPQVDFSGSVIATDSKLHLLIDITSIAVQQQYQHAHTNKWNPMVDTREHDWSRSSRNVVQRQPISALWGRTYVQPEVGRRIDMWIDNVKRERVYHALQEGTVASQPPPHIFAIWLPVISC